MTCSLYAQRIISTAPSNTEIISALGYADKLIAVDPYSSKIPGVPQGLPLIDFASPNAEAIVAMQPDIIFASEINRSGAGDDPFKLLREMGIHIIYIPTANSIKDIYSDINQIAQSLHAEPKGRAIVQGMQAELASIAAVGKTIRQKKKVYWEVSSFPNPVSFGSGVYLNEIIELVGAENIFAKEKGWFSPSAENIIIANPDVILEMFYEAGNTASQGLARRPGFQVIKAVKNKALYMIDADSASRTSPGIVKAIKEVAHSVYPEYYD
ncbi:MAG: ABC transporter substrate-binding protein [Spirochaetaceae bacterium]|jgi:iron complex transport system substrate-binding protein|nr:ABC transporter substrate-binding protein [Spirochaetaceae bacterium]